MKNTILVAIIVAVVFGAGGFYGGMQFSKGKNSTPNFAGGNFRGGANAGAGMAGGAQRRGQAGGGFVNGQILSADANSLTIQLRQGNNATGTTANAGSKIVLFSDATEVGKFVSGTPADLVAGANVMVTGKTNTDGSISAQSIQIRPIGAPNGGPGEAPIPPVK
ncbi:MAG: hypothetical protein WCP18_02310 [bacterium]